MSATIVRLALVVAGLTSAVAGCVRWSPQRAPITAPAILAVPDVAPEAAPYSQLPVPAAVQDAARERRPQAEEAERLLSYFERLKRLQGVELAKEHEAARLAYARSASEFNRISYVMTLSLPGTPFSDDARALELLQPVLRKSENGLRPLGILLATFIQERRRLGVHLAAVQQKLDALRSLERRLIERDQNIAPRK